MNIRDNFVQFKSIKGEKQDFVIDITLTVTFMTPGLPHDTKSSEVTQGRESQAMV